jgi:CRP-like cAMP-binding protein
MCHRYSVARVDIETLNRVPLFAGMEKKELESIASTMRERTFPAGSIVTAEGSGGAGFFVVAEGEGEVTVHGELR